MPKTPKITTIQVKEALPEHYRLMAERSFISPYNGNRYFVRVRTKDLDTKSPLYLYDTVTNGFVSSLYYCPHTARFVFDISDGDKRKFYSVDTTLNTQEETSGYYPDNSALYEQIKDKLNKAG